jgi:hypothetical protein
VNLPLTLIYVYVDMAAGAWTSAAYAIRVISASITPNVSRSLCGHPIPVFLDGVRCTALTNTSLAVQLATDYRRPLKTFKSSFRAAIGLYFFKESFT